LAPERSHWCNINLSDYLIGLYIGHGPGLGFVLLRGSLPVPEQPFNDFLFLEKEHFTVGLGIWDLSHRGELVQITSGYSRKVTGLLKSQHFLIGDQ
tara:strand:- start:4858 stop:5145 length:288 start_codon:yes stop_codon:yes gene_type:complete